MQSVFSLFPLFFQIVGIFSGAAALFRIRRSFPLEKGEMCATVPENGNTKSDRCPSGKGMKS